MPPPGHASDLGRAKGVHRAHPHSLKRFSRDSPFLVGRDSTETIARDIFTHTFCLGLSLGAFGAFVSSDKPKPGTNIAVEYVSRYREVVGDVIAITCYCIVLWTE